MAQRSPNYALVLIIFTLGSIATLWAREKPSVVLYEPTLTAIPMNIGSWEGRDEQIPSEQMAMLNADKVLSRTYVDAKSQYGLQSGLLVVYRKYGRRDFIHRPEACYPAAGWSIVETGTTTMPYAGKTITAKKVVAEKDGARDIIVYWFASGERTEHNYMRQQLWMAMDRFQTRKYGWAFIRINAPVLSSDEDTLDSTRRFASLASHSLLNSLTGSTK